MNAKAKGTKAVTPKDLVEVNADIAEIGSIDRELGNEKRRLEAAFERLRAQSLERLQNVVLRRNTLVKGIARYAKKNRDTILPHDRKSIELASGTFGWRFDPWKVVVTGSEETIINWLEAEKKPQFLRRKVELNREQLLEVKPDNIPGVRFEQKERFFIEPKEEKVPEGQSSVVSLVRVA